MRCTWLLLAALPAAAEDPCTAPANAVVAENCKQGVSSDVWDVNGAGSPGVRGFATQASVLPGENVEFKIKLQFGEALKRVDIFRLGYYDGRGARVMGRATLDKYASTRAVTAICREGVAYSCAKWPVAASWNVEGPSGLYVARFVLADQTKGWRNDASPIVSDNHHAVEGRDASLPPEKLAHAYGAGGKNKPREGWRLKEPRASHAYFVVRSPEKHDLLFQTADLTWHAATGHGGLARPTARLCVPYLHEPYRGDEFLNLSDPKHVHKRAHAKLRHAVDHARLPVGERTVRAYQIAAIRFLERMGYDVHYATGFDLSGKHADNILKRSRAYLSVGHDVASCGNQPVSSENLNAIEQTLLRRQHRGDGVGRRNLISTRRTGRTASATRSSGQDVEASTSTSGARTRPTGPCASRADHDLL